MRGLLFVLACLSCSGGRIERHNELQQSMQIQWRAGVCFSPLKALAAFLLTQDLTTGWQASDVQRLAGSVASRQHSAFSYRSWLPKRPMGVFMDVVKGDASMQINDGSFDPPVSSRFLPPLSAFEYLKASDVTVLKHAEAMFQKLKSEAAELSKSPLTAAFGERIVLDSSTLSEVATAVLAEKLRVVAPEGSPEAIALREEIGAVMGTPKLIRCLVCDLYKILQVDPAADGVLQPLLFFKGLHGLLLQRVAHELWLRDGPADKYAALRLQSHGSELFGVDIHPGAEIGPGVMIDHATAVVIGGTCVLGSDIYMLHQVTLGATGKPMYGAKRHPTIGNGVTLGAGATILGDISMADGVTVGAAAVVTRPVEEGCTVIGVNKILDNRQKKPEDEDYTWMYNI